MTQKMVPPAKAFEQLGVPGAYKRLSGGIRLCRLPHAPLTAQLLTVSARATQPNATEESYEWAHTELPLPPRLVADQDLAAARLLPRCGWFVPSLSATLCHCHDWNPKKAHLHLNCPRSSAHERPFVFVIIMPLVFAFNRSLMLQMLDSWPLLHSFTGFMRNAAGMPGRPLPGEVSSVLSDLIL